MTARQPCPPAPGPLEAFAVQFDPLFGSLGQRRSFRGYLSGLLAPRDRNKTLTALAGAEPVVQAQSPEVPRLHYFHTQTGMADHIGSIPIMRIRTPNLAGPAWAIKRGFDILVSSLLLILTAPVMVICMLAVRLEGGPGVLFRQARVGRPGWSCRNRGSWSGNPPEVPDRGAGVGILDSGQVRTLLWGVKPLWVVIRAVGRARGRCSA